MPIAHHDGNYYATEDELKALEGEDRVAFRYSDNPNGSMSSIAGVLSANRRVLGMMPHPERAMDAQMGSADGQALFRALVEQTTRPRLGRLNGAAEHRNARACLPLLKTPKHSHRVCQPVLAGADCFVDDFSDCGRNRIFYQPVAHRQIHAIHPSKCPAAFGAIFWQYGQRAATQLDCAPAAQQ